MTKKTTRTTSCTSSCEKPYKEIGEELTIVRVVRSGSVPLLGLGSRELEWARFCTLHCASAVCVYCFKLLYLFIWVCGLLYNHNLSALLRSDVCLNFTSALAIYAHCRRSS